MEFVFSLYLPALSKFTPKITLVIKRLENDKVPTEN